jgi:ketosteroid isomerase-like protein
MVRGKERKTSVRSLYAAFNARDIDAALATMTADVDWPNGWERARVKGHDPARGRDRRAVALRGPAADVEANPGP